ncbi:hypothetical protein ENUP19_0305G0031 [Entamoeba nuttalli]|uniref:Uncharacterized protein n=2 Tax=Entamoeba nuttalli TaxID=412467 RepID=K2HF53_ENTNP|nr:hypothetical protein ENU1_055620 [Entamoeba nuttalli P19]EKE41459.1 hypothetical protein ENU1_055620 [Entamoeba nuttalli P19]|eukprot:XP_008856212.1 hypothetical protein ENU1_055620 [Entamoeba nuttalli P19]
MRDIVLFLFFFSVFASDLIDLYNSAYQAFENKANAPTNCLHLYGQYPLNTNYSQSPTDYCYSCITNIFDVVTLNYDSNTGLSSQVRADAVWLSNVQLPKTKGMSYFVSTPSAFLQYPTIEKPFIDPPYLVPLNVVVLYDISSSNSRPSTLFSFFKRFTSMQYLYFLTFNHNPQNVLHRGNCTTDSINQLMHSLCKISYGGGTRYRDAFNKMIDDIKQDIFDKTQTIDIFLVSDGNEIQNRKLLRKSLDRLSEYKISVHTIDTGDGTWKDKLFEISCEENGYYINSNEQSIDILFNALWLRSFIKNNQRIINGRAYSGLNSTKAILKELIWEYDDVIFPTRSFGVVGVIVDENTNITDEEKYITEPKVTVRDLDIQKYVLRSYTGGLCGNEITPTTEEMNAIKLTLRSIDNWYTSSSETTDVICKDVSSKIIGSCDDNGTCVKINPSNYYLKEKCSCSALLKFILCVFLLIILI